MKLVLSLSVCISFFSVVLSPLAYAEDAESLLPVDCLLPGQVRRMGTITTFVTPRRPVKTTAIDCEIRGGEYVSYDRASYKTALNIWLSSAESGNAKAQLYVAHIYEKGLGVAPDFAVAATWYQKASEGGNVEASLGLAQLYEKGLGVPQNLNKAKALYAIALGGAELVELNPATLALTGTGDNGSVTLNEGEYKDLVTLLGGDPDESYTLTDLVRIHSNEKTALKTSLEDANDAIDAQTGILSNELQRAADLKLRLANSEKQLGQLEQQRYDQSKTIGSLQSKLKAPEKALANQNQKIEALVSDISKRESETLQLKTSLENLAGDAKKRKKAEKKIASLQKSLTRQNSKLDSEKSRQIKLKENLNQKSIEIARLQTTTQNNEREIAQLKSAIATPQLQLAEQSEIIADLQGQVDAANMEAQRFKNQLDEAADAAQKLALDELVGPSLAMIEPSVQQTRGVALVSILSSITTRQVTGRVDAPAGLLSLTVNGESQKVNDKGIFTVAVNIEDKRTPVDVVAVDVMGKRSEISFEMSTEATVVKAPKRRKTNFGKYYALIIGNSEYQFLPDLVTPKADVTEVARVLKDSYGFETKVLFDVGRSAIINELNEFRKKLTSEDNFLIYYAGHGGLDEVNNRGHWLPVDADWDNPANWLNNTVITDFLNIINAKQILVVSDSCYSGALTRSALVGMQGGMTEREHEKYLEVLSRKKARTALTSGGLKPVLDTGGGRHSVFSQAFLESLENNKGVIEGQRLYREVLARVSLRAANINFEQEPEYAPISFAGHEGGDFLLVPSNTQ